MRYVSNQVSHAFAQKLAARGVVIPLGGNNPAGALGHASAALELADQIDNGDADAALAGALLSAGAAAGVRKSGHLEIRDSSHMEICKY